MREGARVSVREFTALGLAVLVFAVSYTASIERDPVASAETRFVETSASGLNIVPASCPSSPHYLGECSSYSQGSYFGYSQGGYEGYSQGSYEGYSQGSYEGYSQGNYGGQCTPYLFCKGSQVWRFTTQCVEEYTGQNCVYGCTGGGCLPAPPGEGNIIVTPALIQSGETTVVSWETTGMLEDTCSVVENNPDILDTGSGPDGTFVSSVIHQQTSYTLICTREDESLFVDNATVNIVPIWQESGN